MFQRDLAREERLNLQKENIGIPKLPTTTIGSFPQTVETRSLRRAFKSGEVDKEEYSLGIKEIIKETVQIQDMNTLCQIYFLENYFLQKDMVHSK